MIPANFLIETANPIIRLLKTHRIWLGLQVGKKLSSFDRKDIHQIYNAFIFSELHLNKYLNFLENNATKATGSFPQDFLKIGESKEMTRLVQLEERWRNAEERDQMMKMEGK